MRILMHLRPDWRELHGGDLVQLQRWALWLQEFGVAVEVTDAQEPELRGIDLVHFHNLGRTTSILDAWQHCKSKGVATVLTPLYWPAEEFERLGRPGYTGRLAALLPHELRERLKATARSLRQRRSLNDVLSAAWTNNVTLQRRFLTGFDGLVVNSLAEVEALSALTTRLPPTQIVHSGVDAFFWSEERSLWALESTQLLPNGKRVQTPPPETTEPPSAERAGVLCVARFDPQKAQHRLIEAVRPLGVPLTLAGSDNPNHPTYRRFCQRKAGANVTILPRVSANQLKALYRSCRVHALTSWYETTGLTALEAGCCGARSVVTARGGTRDYGGELVWYAQPAQLTSLRAAVERALQAAETPDLLTRVRAHFTWERSARALLKVYEAVLAGKAEGAFTSPSFPLAA